MPKRFTLPADAHRFFPTPEKLRTPAFNNLLPSRWLFHSNASIANHLGKDNDSLIFCVYNSHHFFFPLDFFDDSRYDKSHLDPILGYDIPEIITSIHPSLMSIPMHVGISCCDDVIPEKTIIHMCQPSEAKYLLLTITGGKAHLYDETYHKDLIIDEEYPTRDKFKKTALYHACIPGYKLIHKKVWSEISGWHTTPRDAISYYTDIWVLPLGYSCAEPLDPNIAENICRPYQAKERQRIIMEHLQNEAWCETQRQKNEWLMEIYSSGFRRPIPLITKSEEDS